MSYRRLSVRSRKDGVFEVGPAGHGPTVIVNAPNRKVALVRGKARLRELRKFGSAVASSFRFTKKINTQPEAQSAPVDVG